MTSELLFENQLDLLRAIYPVKGFLHVGAGAGVMLGHYREWDIPSLVLVDADPDRIASLSETVEGIDGWLARHAVLANNNGEVVFHRASNPNESGLIEPEKLIPLWQNLKTVEELKLGATTIKDLFANQVEQNAAATVNWVNIDCLPSLSILQGAGELVESWDVVQVRTVLDESLLPGLEAMGKRVLDEFMAKRGFEYAAHEPERHPAIGRVLYVRNWKKLLLAELEAQKKEQHEQRNELQNQLALVIAARDEQSKLAAERGGEIEQRRGENNALKKQFDELQEQAKKITTERDELQKLTGQYADKIAALTKALAELKAQTDKFASERDEQSKLAAERGGELEQQRGENDALKKQFDELQEQAKKLTTERDEHQKLTGQHATELAVLTKAHEELEAQTKKRPTELEQSRQLHDEQKKQFLKFQAQFGKGTELIQAELSLILDELYSLKKKNVLTEVRKSGRHIAATTPSRFKFSKEKSCNIIVAGMRHSGSTALFNIIRLGLLDAGVELKSGYSEINGLDNHLPDNKGVFLLKTHELRDDVVAFGDIVFTLRRDLRDTIASATRRNFPYLKKFGHIEYAKHNRMLHDIWLPYSEFELIYEEFMNNPVEQIQAVLSVLGIKDCDPEKLNEQLNNLPTDEYDITLLSPSHVTDPERKLSYLDTLDKDVLKKIESQNMEWLSKYDYI